MNCEAVIEDLDYSLIDANACELNSLENKTSALEIDLEIDNHNMGVADSNPVNGSNWEASSVLISISLFILAGLLEVGGGYLVWIGIRQKVRPILCISMGFVILMLYGVVPTFQPVDSFGRTFAVYGGFFIVLSYLWAYIFDGMKLDAGDYFGGSVAIVGVCIAWFWPR